MKITKAKLLIVVVGLVVSLILSLAGLLNLNVKADVAFADTAVSDEQTQEFVVATNERVVPATYEYIRLNDEECSASIKNRDEATKAIFPSKAEIEGKTYKVTAVTANGGMSCPNLERVSLPNSIKKVNNMAFANNPKLTRVNLGNVETLGNTVFYNCLALTDLIIPESVTTVGIYVFRNNDTQVRLRAESIGAGWAERWNLNNKNQEVEYGSTYVQPLELEAIYDSRARSNPQITGYALASGQPRTDNFYTIDSENKDDYTDIDNENNIFIPAQFEGVDILAIDMFAFEGASFNQLVFEYSDKELSIGLNSFAFTKGTNITINRPISFFDLNMEMDSDNIFTESTIDSIVLPKNITTLPAQTFFNCKNLKNIFFVTPHDVADRSEALNIVNNLKAENTEGVVHLPDGSNITVLGESVFSGVTSITELHLDDTITEVGASNLSGWNNESQTVYVHNTFNIETWDPDWNSSFENIIYDKYFYNVQFDPNGGNVSVTNKEVEYNAPIGDLPTPSKSNYDFMGWFTEDGKLFNNETVYDINSDCVLHAEWEKTKYTITFDKGAGSGGDNEVIAYYGEKLPSIAIPERTGYVFDGYWDNPNGKGTKYFDEDGMCYDIWTEVDITQLYAHWINGRYTVTLMPEEGEGGMQTITVTYDEDMPTNVVAPIRPGYAFQGYYSRPDGYGDKYFNSDMSSAKKWDIPKDGISLYAHWTIGVYDIYYDLDYSFISDVPAYNNENNPAKIMSDKTIQLYDPERLGYKFDGWYLNGLKVDKLTNISSSITLRAKWIGTKYLLQTSTSNNRLNVSGNYSIVYIDSYAPSAEYEINATSAVNQLCVYSSRNCNIKLKIVFESSMHDVTLILNNIKMTAPNFNNGVVVKSTKTLHLYGYNSSITGGEGLTISNMSVMSGASAIYCNSLEIHTSITLRGGCGRQGQNAAGGVAVALHGSSSKLKISGDNVTIIGGNCSLYGNAPKGIPVYCKKTYTKEITGKNVSLIDGSGTSSLTYTPVIGYYG